ncbi:hypothetical protein M413DRAFT_32405 [Hebeloma cylindrosporum]|uniref:Uncharacterized protein n=1 Tax=Hebeloma cylindrosporum TaxID=76867 RepID=A0A0C2Y368_HEBCY|nr:hypothetical protein M413DRAFT_32405 [Hebeloma cylindrosporum h7]
MSSTQTQPCVFKRFLLFEDAFPNAGQLFHDALALPNPAPTLLELLKEHPTYGAVRNLLDHYTLAVHEDPSRANALATALVAIRDSPDAPVTDGRTLQEIFPDELPEYHAYGFGSGDNKHQHIPTHLPAVRIYNQIRTTEIKIIGACIQLLTSGLIIVRISDNYVESANEAATKLKATKLRGIVKDSNGRQLLELAISHAETGFKSENDMDNAWEVLFPQT